MPRIQDWWEKIVQDLHLDLSQPVNYVRASDVQRISGKQPRLVASMDSEQKLPSLFRRFGVFVLPSSNDTYAIVHGNGYHKLEPIESEPERFRARLPFKLTTLAYGKGENRYLLHAYDSGLLGHFSQVRVMYETLTGKGRTGNFKCRINEHAELPITGAQMEIDKAYEGRRDVLLFEAKADRRDNFLIRQLYFPFRVASGLTPKPIRPFLFLANPRDRSYSIWEYRWEDSSNYEDIHVVARKSFLVVEEEPEIDALDAIEADPHLDIVPQADDLQKVAEFPLLVGSGVSTAQAWADHYGITVRQGSYYREAAEALGLVLSRDGEYHLTAEGTHYVNLDSPQRGDFLTERILRVPIMNRVYRKVREDPACGVGRENIAKLIEQTSHLRGTTPIRRASTVLSYFRWIAKTTGTVIVVEGHIYGRQHAIEEFDQLR